MTASIAAGERRRIARDDAADRKPRLDDRHVLVYRPRTCNHHIRTMMSADEREVIDRTFWTPYDYYMTEREVRARRRAHAYAAIAMLARRAGLLIARLARPSLPLTQPREARY